MELIKNKTFGGERPLFGAHDVRLEDITITDGESGIKCCKNLEWWHSMFWQHLMPDSPSVIVISSKRTS